MYGCQQELIKCHEKLPFLEHLCATTNKLINCGIYWARQWYFKLGHIAGKYELEKELKRNPNYQFLHSQAAQQTLRGVAESFKSYKELSRKHLAGEIENFPRLPKYRKKGGMSVITYPKQALKLKKNKVRVPLGKKVKAAFKVDSFLLNYPSNLDFKSIRGMRIVPRNGCFYKEKVLGIDHGVDNWLTCVSNLGTSFIVDGKHLKSVNQFYNKQIATIKKNKPQGFWSKKLANITEKRHRQMRDAVNKVARLVINRCLKDGIGRIVFGWNKREKDGIDIGAKNNQKFVEIPTAQLKERIKQLWELYGIEFIETEESYTSKASFLDDDFLPHYGEKPVSWKSSGKRIKRGLYQTKNGLLVNADANGAANILRKVATTLRFSLKEVGSGPLTSPLRVRFWTAFESSPFNGEEKSIWVTIPKRRTDILPVR